MPLDTVESRQVGEHAPPAAGASALAAKASRPAAITVKSIIAKWGRWIAIAAVVVILAIGALAFNPFGQTKPQVVTGVVALGNIEQSVLAVGTLQPARLISVGAQVSGQVKKLYVDVGSAVKQGDSIADIDSTTEQNNVSNAEAGLNNIQAQRAATAVNLIQAQQTLARDKLLYDQGAISQAEYQTAIATAGQLTNQLKALDAQIKQSGITLATAKVDLGYAKIVAPMDGTIVAVITEEGQTVNANQSAPTIVKLAQLDKMTVSAQVSEADVENVKSGQTVYFTTLGDARTRHYAKLRSVDPAPPSMEDPTVSSTETTPTAVYYNGLFDVDNADGALRTGMTAQVYIVQASAQNILVVPSSALGRRNSDGTYPVKVVGAQSREETRQVKVGINTNVIAQVLDGLKLGEVVVIGQVSSGAKAPVAGQSGRNPASALGGAAPRGGGSRP